MLFSRAAVLLLLVLCPPAGAASVHPADIESTGTPNAAYLDAVRGRGLQTEIAYLHAGATLPDIGGVAVPEAPELPDPGAERRNWAIFFGVLLALILGFAVWHGRGISASFGAARDPRRAGAPADEAPAPTRDLPADAFLESLRAMPDRRRALILLVARALDRAAAANGLRLGRAQTARDVLRAVPRAWPHFETLRRLVAQAEIVHFGGRELAEEQWRACLERARPLLGAERPA
jgi:hypothetical protein